MTIVRYNNNPLIRELFDNDFFAPFFKTTNEAAREWSPRMDIYEKEGTLHLVTELPGVTKEDVKLKYEDGLLSISADRKANTEDEGRHYYARELVTGSYTRSLKIGTRYDVDKINATYTNGVLTVTLPQKEETLPVEIKVN